MLDHVGKQSLYLKTWEKAEKKTWMDLTEFKILSVKSHCESSKKKKKTNHENICNIYLTKEVFYIHNFFNNNKTKSSPAEKQVKYTKDNLYRKKYKWLLNLRKGKTNLNSDQISENQDET